MATWREIVELFQDDPFRDHPQLKVLPRDEALTLLDGYRARAHEALPAWVTAAHWVTAGLIVTSLILMIQDVPGGLVAMLLSGAAGVLVERIASGRIRKHVDAAIQADFNAGRTMSCLACGYDLRATTGTSCPECGRSTVDVHAAFTPADLAWRVHRRRELTARIAIPLCFLPATLLGLIAIFEGEASWILAGVMAAVGAVGASAIALWWAYLRHHAPPRPDAKEY